jgi:hypothetical protein
MNLTPKQRWVLALTSAAPLMVSPDTQVVATALPVIRLHLPPRWPRSNGP